MDIYSRILFIRPDSYGDIVLFEPVLRHIRTTMPQTDIAVIVRNAFLDIAHILPAGVQWIGTTCDPYIFNPNHGEIDEPLNILRAEIEAFNPTAVVSACFSKTWLDAVIMSWCPNVFTLSLGTFDIDIISFSRLERRFPEANRVEIQQEVEVPLELADWKKNGRLAEHILGVSHLPDAKPRLHLPSVAQDWAQKTLQQLTLNSQHYVACCGASNTSVQIKAWTPSGYAALLGYIWSRYRLPTLLLGSEIERNQLEQVRVLAMEQGVQHIAIWTGSGGDIAHFAALIQQAHLYFGNDTSAAHMSSALGVPGVAVFGGGTWPRFIPAGNTFATIVQELPCFGCGWNCPFGNAPCLKRIPIDAVIPVVDEVLNSPTTTANRVVRLAPCLTEAEYQQAGTFPFSGLEGSKKRDAVLVSQLLHVLDTTETVQHHGAEQVARFLSRMKYTTGAGQASIPYVERWLRKAAHLTAVVYSFSRKGRRLWIKIFRRT